MSSTTDDLTQELIMFQVIRKQTRSSTATPFFVVKNSPTLSTEIMDYFIANYALTNKFISSDNVVSENGLELTTTMLWESSAAHASFNNDPYIVENLKNAEQAYLNANGITLNITTQDI